MAKKLKFVIAGVNSEQFKNATEKVTAKIEQAQREALAKHKREVPLKVCHMCYAYAYNPTKICAVCGHQFYLSKKDKAALTQPVNVGIK